MNSLIDGLRSIIGVPSFYDAINGVWHYDLMVEYVGCLLLVLVVVCSIFRLISKAVYR